MYVDGKLAGQAEASGAVVHPGLNDARERDGAEYFDGDMSDPELFKEALSEERIQQLAAAGIPSPLEPPEVEWAGGAGSELLFWQDGSYTLQGAAGKSSLKISGIGKPVEISGTVAGQLPTQPRRAAGSDAARIDFAAPALRPWREILLRHGDL